MLCLRNFSSRNRRIYLHVYMCVCVCVKETKESRGGKEREKKMGQAEARCVCPAEDASRTCFWPIFPSHAPAEKAIHQRIISPGGQMPSPLALQTWANDQMKASSLALLSLTTLAAAVAAAVASAVAAPEEKEEEEEEVATTLLIDPLLLLLYHLRAINWPSITVLIINFDWDHGLGGWWIRCFFLDPLVSDSKRQWKFIQEMQNICHR